MIDYILQVIAEAAHRYDVSQWLLEKTLRCESINFRWAVIIGEQTGPAGELGIAQLHPRGLLPLYYQLGYESPFSILQSVDFMAWAFSKGMAFDHWSCANLVVRGLSVFH